jgi:hypothetical protein
MVTLAYAPSIFADATTAPLSGAQPGFSLTIYSTADPATFDPRAYLPQASPQESDSASPSVPGYGVVRENRVISLNQGENAVRFTDVACGIDPTTVSFQSLTAPQAASVEEQNYEFDLVSADKLLNKYLDKEVRVTRRPEPGGAAAEVISGTLLSCDPANIVLQDSQGTVRVLTRGSDIASIELAKSDQGLITKPTLLWKIFSTQAGQHLAQVTYQTDRLTWRADYNITVNADESASDIGAWVTILNQSGAAYPEAKLKLVAGDVQRISPPQQVYAVLREAEATQLGAAAGFVEKAFFEYHIYTLATPTSLANNSTKQIELFAPKQNIPVTKTYVYYGVPQQLRYLMSAGPNQDQNPGLESNKKVDVYLFLTNSEKNGLGIPLPAGRIRVYKSDPADGAKEFIGEDVIQHTPKDEQVMVKLGDAFDIVGDRRQTEFHVDDNGHVITESFEIKLRNHKQQAVDVIVKENLYRWNNWEVTESSDKWEKQDYRTIHFPVSVPPNGQKIVNYTVKYTW